MIPFREFLNLNEEQLQELSKDTLYSYRRKAYKREAFHKTMAQKAMDRGTRAQINGDRDEMNRHGNLAVKQYKKMEKRKKGIRNASDAINKKD